jgi:hypothetical protein
VLSGVISASYVFSPTLVNEFSLGSKGHKRQMADPDPAALNKLTRAGAGVTALGQFHPEINPLGILPAMSFGGVVNAASLSYDGRFPLEAVYADYSVVDGLTKVYKAHTFKVGVDMKFIYTKNAGHVARGQAAHPGLWHAIHHPLAGLESAGPDLGL